jgi:hypothetical protein
MAGLTTTTAADAIADLYSKEVAKTFYDATPIFNHFGPLQPSQGGDSYDWFVQSAGNGSAEEFSEGDPAPAAGNLTMPAATLAYRHYQATVQLTGHARAALKNGHLDLVDREMMGGRDSLLHKIEEGMATDLASAIDDSTNYAGLTRATYNLSSVVTSGSSAALTLSLLKEMWEDLHLDGRATDWSDLEILSSQEQATAYTEAADDPGGVYMRKDIAGGTMDLGRFQAPLQYNSRPWFVMPTLTNSIVMFTKRSNVKLIEHEGVKVSPLGKTEDADKFLLTWRGRLVHTNPYHAGKLESLAT